MSDFMKHLPHHFFSACISLVRHMAMTLTSISAVIVTLLLIAVFMILAGNLNSFAVNVEGNLKIHATIDKMKTEQDIHTMEASIQEIEGIQTVTFSSREQELDTLIEESGTVFSRYEENNPMSDAFIIEVNSAQDIQTVTQKLLVMDGIDEAQYGGDSIQKLVDTLEAVRAGGTIFIVVLSILAIFLINNTIKMTIYTRDTEISIMRSVGANNGYIVTPFMLEGMLIGLCGALIVVIIVSTGYSALYHGLDGHFLSSMFILQKPFPYVAEIAVLLIVSGAGVGLLGSFLASMRYLRWHR